MFFFIVKVVEPAFPTVLRRFKMNIVGSEEEVLGHLVPATSSLLIHSFSEKFVVLKSPVDLSGGFYHTEILEL
jgi:hypothetical protein